MMILLNNSMSGDYDDHSYPIGGWLIGWFIVRNTLNQTKRKLCSVVQ
jgi:hypothetical protein